MPIAAAGAVLVGAATYTRDYFFLFDDTSLLTNAGAKSVVGIFTSPSHGFYRPMVTLIQKAEMAAFGWTNPAGFALVSLIVHAISAVLLCLLVGSLTRSKLAPIVAGLLFLASPWATEATMWVSGQFDVVAVLFSLVSLLTLVRFVRGRGAWWLVGAGGMLGAALLSKENVFALVAVAPLSALAAGGWRVRGRVGVLVTVTAVYALTAGAFLAARSVVLPGLSGPYGSLGAAWANMTPAVALLHLEHYAAAFATVSGKLPPSIASGAWMYVAVILVLLAVNLAHWRSALALTISLAAVLAPTLWMDVGMASTYGSRILYLPGAVWAVALGGGAGIVAGWVARSRIAAIVAGCVLVGVLSVALAATAVQSGWWRFAAVTSRNVVGYVLAQPLTAGECVQVTNMPAALSEGPLMLKSYNFRHLLAVAGGPDVAFTSSMVLIAAGAPTFSKAAGMDRLGADCGEGARQIAVPLDLLRA